MEENYEETVENEETISTKKPINLGKGGLIYSIWNFFEAALLVVVGVLCFVWIGQAENASDKTAAYNRIVSTIIFVGGIFLIVAGALRILVNFMPVIASNKLEAAAKKALKASIAYDLVIVGSIELALGIALTATYTNNGGNLTQFAEFLTHFAATFIGVITLVAGGALIMFAIGFIISKLYKLYMPITEIIFGLALIALGVVVLWYSGDSAVVAKVTLIIVAVLLFLGAIGLVIKTINDIHHAQLKKAAANAVADIIVNDDDDYEEVSTPAKTEDVATPSAAEDPKDAE